MYSCNNYTNHFERLGSQNVLKTLITLDLFLEGLKMTQKVETCSHKIVFYVINYCVFYIFILFMIIL